MHKSSQEKEDELIALAILRSEEEQYEKGLINIPSETFLPDYYMIPPQRFQNLENRRINQRFNNFFNEHEEYLYGFGAVNDSMPMSEIIQFLESPNHEKQPEPMRQARPIEEVKNRRPADEMNVNSINQRSDPRSRVLFNSRSRANRPAPRNNIVNAGRDIAFQQRINNFRGRPRMNHSRPSREALYGGQCLSNDIANYMFDDEGNAATYEVLTHLDDNNFDKGNGFKESELRRLKVVDFNTRIFKSTDQCSVCMTELRNNEKVVGLKCEHIYHETCIKEWLSRKKTCPVCKEDVRL